MKWGHTRRTERRNASGTEQSRRLITGPTRATQRVEDQSRKGQEGAGDAVGDDKDGFREQEAEPRQGAQDLGHWLRRLVALDRAHQAFEHAAVEGEPQGRHTEEHGAEDGAEAEVVDGELGEPGALDGRETEDHHRGDQHPRWLQAKRPPRHGDELERVQGVPARLGGPPIQAPGDVRLSGGDRDLELGRGGRAVLPGPAS